MKAGSLKSILLKIFLVIVLGYIFRSFITHTYAQSFNDFFITGSVHAFSSIYSWTTVNFGANASGEIWRFFPFTVYYSFFNQTLHIPLNLAQFILLVALHALGFWSFYELTKKVYQVSGFSIACFIGALFFIFNTYTLTQLANSYLLVMPYLVLPLQLLLLIKGLEKRELVRYALLIAAVNTMVFGANLIFDFIAISLLISYGLWTTLVLKQFKFFDLIKIIFLMSGVTIVFNLWWLLPMLVSSLQDKVTTQYVLTSEAFYNFDSSPSNVLRGLGDWAFFSGFKGIPYNAFASVYKTNPLVVGVGYILSGLAILALALSKNILERKRLLFFGVVVAILLPFIGGTYPSWPSHGLMSWLFGHVPYFAIFRNTYKWASLLTLSYAMMLTALMIVITKKNVPNNLKPILFGLVSILIVINSWPYFNNQVFSTRAQFDALPKYWSQAAEYINGQLPVAESRILLLPNQYFPVFVWPRGVRSFYRNPEAAIFGPSVVHNTCSGCSQFRTASYLTYIYKNLHQPNIFKLIGLLGVTHILQRNDYDSAYYDVETPEQVKTILSATNDISLVKSFGKLDIYKVDQRIVSPRISSPDHLISIDQLADGLGAFSDFNAVGHKTDLVLTSDKLDGDNATLANSNYYHSLFATDTAQVKGDQITEKLKLLEGSYKVFQRRPYDNTTNRAFILQSSGNRQNLADQSIESTDKAITVGVNLIRERKNLLPNSSFENGTWQKQVGDCQLADPRATITMKNIDDHTDGKKGLELGAITDNACTYSSPIQNFDRTKNYIFAMDYKVINGKKAGYCIWDGFSCIRSQDLTQSDHAWHHAEAAIEPQPTSKQLTVFLYAPSAPDSPSLVHYDNVSVQALKENVLSAYAIKTAQEKLIKAATVTFKQVNPTLYRVQDHQTDKSLIVFQESYHPGWRAYVTAAGAKPQAWWQVLFMQKPGWEVAAQDHIIANSFANGWWVDPAKFPAGLKNSSGNYTVTLEYWPQRLVYSGGAISGLTLLGCIGYLFYAWRKRRRGRTA